MTRRTTMFFTVYPPTTNAFGWMGFTKRVYQHMSFILWCRVVRKTPRDRIVGNIHVETRQLNPKWHDRSGATGIVEATATWEVSGE